MKLEEEREAIRLIQIKINEQEEKRQQITDDFSER